MRVGLEVFLDNAKAYRGLRLGLLCNPTAVTKDLEHAADLIAAHDDLNLIRLFGPEHGIRGAAQDMETVETQAHDPQTGIEVINLYGESFETLSPTSAQLQDLDILIYDIQDIGARYYTYQATLALCMKVAAQSATKVLVLDRPNPIGGTQIEGGGLEPGLENFCGLYPIPQRHGLTVGELASLYQKHYELDCELEIVRCEGYAREYFDAFASTELPWVMQSPNMPTLDSAIVYPGMCLLEGSNLSEGRGTTRPFELFGAPFVQPGALSAELSSLDLPGVHFRPCWIKPMFQKWAGQLCGAAQIHVSDRTQLNAFKLGIAVLWTCNKLYPKDFQWRREKYEFRDDVPAIDLLFGTPKVRQAIDSGASFEAVVDLAHFGTEIFDNARESCLLY